MLARVRLALAVAVFALYSVPAALHLYGGWIVRKLLRVRPGRTRRFAAEWRAFWGDHALRAVCRALDVRLDFEIPAEALADPTTPVIVVANHRKTLDILIITALLRRMGRPPTEWVLKKQLLHRAAYLGHSCWMSGSAFVGRDGDDDDLFRIARSARLASETASSYVIFPEGTRYDARKRRDGLVEVLPPKRGGFSILKASLPKHHVLSVTIAWRDSGGASALDSHSIVGQRLRVSCALHAPEAAAADGWLDAEWRRKDEELRSA